MSPSIAGGCRHMELSGGTLQMVHEINPQLTKKGRKEERLAFGGNLSCIHNVLLQVFRKKTTTVNLKKKKIPFFLQLTAWS